VPADAAERNEFEGVMSADVGGVTLAYRELGEGEPVVFVHGSVSDLRTWEQQLPAIAESHRAISYSRRYARPNADIPADVDDEMLVHVEDLAAFLSAAGAAPAHLVGNSWGAFICLLTAIRYPEAVRSLVLEEPPVLPLVIGAGARPDLGLTLANLIRRPRTTLAILRFGARTVAPVQKAFRAGDDERAMEIFITGVLGQAAYERLPERRKEQMRENNSALKAQMLGAGFPKLSAADVRGVKAPTLLVTGEHSPAVLLKLTDLLAELLPGVERVEISAASHVMHEENAAAVNAALLRFIG
jgi:pimeloyl-ACP methyl ester carboxylesterase